MGKREVSNNMFSTTAYYWAQMTCSILTFFWYPFLLTCTEIWWFGLRYMSFKGFCEWWGILTLTCFVGSAFGFMMGCSLPKFNNAQIVVTLFIMLFSLGAGFLVNAGSGATWLVQVVTRCSPLYYACELMFKRI